MKLPITLVVITLNEAHNIERCLQSASELCAEMLVVDSQSEDKTCEIAQRLGARVLQKSWMGFGPQKRWATEQAQNDWILSLDADETLSPELEQEIRTKFKQLQKEIAYEMPRKSFHLGRWIGHGGWYPDYQTRFFHRQFSNWPDASIHERVQSQRLEKLESPILHYVFKNLSDQVRTNDRYSGLLAEKDFKSGKSFSMIKLILKPWSKFFECYFLKLGLLDGLPGFLIAVSASYSIFLRWAKIWELERRNDN